MNIYISGICGTGMGPLALMAAQAGHQVFGSDRQNGLISPELDKAGISYEIGPQDGSYLQKISRDHGIDWFVYTSALPADHPELLLAQKISQTTPKNISKATLPNTPQSSCKPTPLRLSKRDEFINFLIQSLDLKLVAVAGTHGKTTTTSMIIWTCRQLDLPVAWLAGSNLGFAPSGSYSEDARYFIYEADEYDRNFLHFSPWLAVIPAVSYDHSDIYPTESDYQAAFDQFRTQSQHVLENIPLADIKIVGHVRQKDAALALAAVERIWNDLHQNSHTTSNTSNNSNTTTPPSSATGPAASDPAAPDPAPAFPLDTAKKILSAFPGVGRRFERLIPGVYSDYAHHPEEIAETIAMAHEEAALRGLRGVVAVYEPHQNTRQHEVLEGYRTAFKGLHGLYWLPTYLTREDKTKKILTPEDFIATLDLSPPSAPSSPSSSTEISSAKNTPTKPTSTSAPFVQPAVAGDDLGETLCYLRDEGYLILLMTAGPADTWLREEIKSWE